MFNRMTAAILGFLVCPASLFAQEGRSTIAILESLAATAALERAVGSVTPNLRIVIDPMIVRANEAPGGRDSIPREATRNGNLAQAFGARVASRSSVIDCRARPCSLRDADVLVTLSQPQTVRGDAKVDAKVTVTTVQQTKRGTQYKTVNVLMKKSGSGWTVVGFEDLGIS
jgi:hypothetical protein